MCWTTAKATKYVAPPVNPSYPDCGQLPSMRTVASSALHHKCVCAACECQGAVNYERWRARRKAADDRSDAK